jgi:hypothetical protein
MAAPVNLFFARLSQERSKSKLLAYIMSIQPMLDLKPDQLFWTKGHRCS